MAKVTIIIPNYNGMPFLNNCLASVYDQTYSDFDVVLIDNASSDNSVSFVRENYPCVQVIPLIHNSGFSNAVNKGMKLSSSPYILLLNNDAVLQPDALHYMVKTLQSNLRYFAVSPKIVSFRRPYVLEGAGDLYNCSGYAVSRGQGRRSSLFSVSGEVFSACGAASLYRHSMLRKLNYFDPDFFAYLEDVDICFRARLHGWTVFYQPLAIAMHVGSATTGGGYSSFKVYHSARNNIILLYKNMPIWMIVLNAPFILFGTYLKYLYFCRRGLEKDYMEGVRRGIRFCMKKRKPNLSFVPIRRLIAIQVDLFVNLFLYMKDFFLTRLQKLREKS